MPHFGCHRPGVATLFTRGPVATLRHTRYQAAVVHDGAILLVRCAFRNGPTVWILPGGGREECEDEESGIVREVLEETHLHVRVERLLFDVAAEPADGTYTRWRTYLCTMIGGDARAGGGEGANADLVDVTWLPLDDEMSWPPEIRSDPYLHPQLEAIRAALGESERELPDPSSPLFF